MKITEIHFGMKKGLPNFSSINCELVASVDKGEDVGKAFDRLKQEAEINLSQDPSWINRD